MTILKAAFAALSGASSSDITPAAVNWADISDGASGSNANQTITSIDTSISLSFSYSGTGTVTVVASVNGGANEISPITVSSGDTVSFTASSGGGGTGTVTVVNDTDSSTTLDTFSVTLTGI